MTKIVRTLKRCNFLNVPFIFFVFFYFNVGHSQKYNIKEFNTENGLPGAQTNSVIQDNKGYLWIATYGGGISRFDGLNFKNYNIQHGLADNRVLSLFLDSRNNIWIGTYGGGVSCFNGKKFVTYNQKHGLSNNIVYGFAEDDDHKIWIATYGGGIDIFDPSTSLATGARPFKNLSTKENLIGNNVWCLMKDIEGNIWAGTEGGISKIANDFSITNYSKSHGLNCVQVWSLMEDTEGTIWAGTYGGGAFSFDGKKFTQHDVFKSPRLNIIYTISQDISGNIWMGSDAGGIAILSKNASPTDPFRMELTTISEKNGLPHNRVRCILKDDEGIMWIGTDGGLSRYAGKVFTQFSTQEGLSDKKVTSVLEDSEKNLWIGTFSGGLNKITFSNDKQDEIEKIENFSVGNGLPGERVWSLMQDSKGQLWIGTNNGIAVYDPSAPFTVGGKKFNYFGTAQGLSNNMIYAIYETEDGKIWIGSDGGISIFDPSAPPITGENIFKNYSVEDGLSHSRVRCIVQDKNKTIWIGTYAGGVNYYKDGKFATLAGEKKLENATVYSIVADNENNIWFSTFGEGVACLKNNLQVKNEFEWFTQANGLGTNSAVSLRIDKKNTLWVGTIIGIDAIDLTSFFTTGKKEIAHFGKDDGFTGIECHQNAAITDSKNKTWFGTINGAIRIDPAQNIYEKKEPKTHIREIKLFYAEKINEYAIQFDSTNGLPKNLVLPYNQNHLTFEFVGLSFLNPQNVKYTFKLENFDSDWSPPSYKNEATYSNLPPGDYSFLVKASNQKDVWNNEAAAFSFSIEAPYWHKLWFIILCSISGIALIVFIIKRRTQKVIRDNKILDTRVKEQTVELTKQNQEKEILLKEIHHRVKNNLQMVSSLLNLQSQTIDDSKALAALRECRNRVNSMAVVHTKLYSTENLSEIDFQSYAEQLYELISTSYILPGKKIDCHISTKNIFFAIDVLIPLGLILTELLSNSFKHAFKNKETGKISVELKTTKNNKHEFIYTDNGIGIDMEMAIVKRSMGMMLLELLSDQLEGKYSFDGKDGFRFSIEF